ncbi:MAG: RNA polymerase sigma factor [Solirubrobacteraceae bacterium]
MEVSALRYSGGIGLHARTPLLRLQSDERLVSLIRRGSTAAFEVLVARYNARLLAFCRHLLGSREDAEDVLQEVFSAAFNAILDDDRPINVRPWLYRIARNRSLNHLRRIQAVGVDSMDIHLSDHGSTTADKVHEREEFRLLVGDIQGLPETQRTALVLREMDALSYEQIAEAMETTVPSVKSLLVRARVSLAEASQARMLTCEEVREELGEVAEGLLRRPGPLVRRHLRTCERCSTFKSQLNETSKALAAVLPIGIVVGGVGGPLHFLRKFAILHIGHSAGASSGASGASAAGQAAAVGSTAAAGASAVMGSTSTGFISASVGAIATKAAAGLAAAALVTAGAVEVDHSGGRAGSQIHRHAAATQLAELPSSTPAASTPAPAPVVHMTVQRHPATTRPHHVHKAPATTTATTPHKTLDKPVTKHTGTLETKPKTKVLPGRTQTQTVATVLPAQTTTSTMTTTPASTCTDTSDATTSPTTTSTSTTPPETSSDPGSTTTATTQSTTPGAASDTPGAASDTTGTSTDSSTPTTTSTSPAPTPAPAMDGGTSCASYSSGASDSTQPPSGGTAP